MTGRLRVSRRPENDPAHRAQTSSYAARVWLQHRLGHRDRTSADPRAPGPGHRRGEGSFVTDIIEPAVSSSGGSARSAGISALRLPELQAMASELGVKGTSKMRKGDLVQAISDARAGSRPQALEPRRAETVAVADAPARRGRAPRAEAPQLDLGGETAPQQERPVRAPRGDALAGLEAALDAKLAPVEHRDDRAARAADAVGGVTG